MPIEVLFRFMVGHAFALSAVPKNFGGLCVGKCHRKGKSAVELDLMEEELNRIRGSHAQ